MRKHWVITAILLFVLSSLLIFQVCGKSSDKIPTLTVANWKGFGSDADYGAPVFEKLYHCKVVHQYFNSEEEILTTLRTGGMGKIDVFLPSTVYIEAARDAGVVEPIDIRKVPSYKSISPDFLKFKGAVDSKGRVYSVPWEWGTTSLGFNPNKVKGDISSWSVLWDPQNAGKVGFFDDSTTAIMVAALYLGEDPQKPNLAKVKEALLKLKKNTRTYWATYDDFLKPYISGEITVGNMWTGIATKLRNSGQPVTYTYPKEGTTAFCDQWMIVKGTKNYDLACKWVNFMVGDQFQTAFATDKNNAHCPVNTNVMSKLTDEQKKVLWIYPVVPKKLVMQQAQSDATKKAWLDLWNEVKAE